MSRFYTYDFINSVYSQHSPSTIHTKNNQLFAFFAKYLFNILMGVYKISVPKTWDKNFTLSVMMSEGYMCVFRTNKFGVIALNTTLSGYNVFYRPSECVIANPLIDTTTPLVIGQNCEVMQLMPNYGSPIDLVFYYADQMAICAETASVNTFGSALGYVFASDSKRTAETFKQMADGVFSGNLAVAMDKDLFDDEGNIRMQMFNTDLKNTFIAPDVMELLRNWEYAFCREIGIPTANEQKKSRMVVDEVSSNNVETATKLELWLETWQDSIDRIKDMFGRDVDGLSVSIRHNPMEQTFHGAGEPTPLNREGGGANE